MIKWYVFQSKFRKESLVCEQLRIRNFDTFFPYIRGRSVHRGTYRVKPYFPGYIFGRLDLEATGSSLIDWIPGAIGVVRFGGEPVPVQDHLIEMLRQHLDTINASLGEFSARFQLGDLVTIQSGPFAGYDAIFNVRLPGRDRVEVLLKLLQGTHIRVELPIEQIMLKTAALEKGV